MIIGITEGGDPSFHPDWRNNANMADGAVIISKRLTKDLRDQILDYYASTNGKEIVHCTCTGFGGTLMEANIPTPNTQSAALYELIWAGFPSDHIVWRCDPIIPTYKGLTYMQKSFEALHAMNRSLMTDHKAPVTRVRISLLDNYPHVRERFAEMKWDPLYNGEFNASIPEMRNTKTALFDAVSKTPVPLRIELCAEDVFYEILTNQADGGVIPARKQGCVSEMDLKIMGFSKEEIQDALSEGENKQNRRGCHCLTCKTELLPNRGLCGGNCKYCYWKNR